MNFLIPLLLELLIDTIWFMKKNKAPKGIGIAIRCIFIAIFYFTDPGMIWLFLTCHVLFFNPIMGFVVANDWFHLGDTKLTDRLLMSNQYTANAYVRTVFTIMLAMILSSGYFWPELWIDLYHEIFASWAY